MDFQIWPKSNARSALFWVITQLIVIIAHRRFGATCRSQDR